MAYLGRARKEDLKTLAEELGMVVGENFKVIQLTELISKSDNYNEPLVKGMLQVFTEERVAKEAAALLEAENVEKQQKIELENFLNYSWNVSAYLPSMPSHQLKIHKELTNSLTLS
ncbi:hypothetical protein NPIL_193451 [Nephila pilipes]|uniref:Uncharacterized protein n=1 Tax=Nephila pilipes TaxID=299642 RepID=A0A8X6N0J8_NEPPI|nr:hypothetical protein NPIL_193451 [Nephila pilipes]